MHAPLMVVTLVTMVTLDKLRGHMGLMCVLLLPGNPTTW